MDNEELRFPKKIKEIYFQVIKYTTNKDIYTNEIHNNHLLLKWIIVI